MANVDRAAREYLLSSLPPIFRWDQDGAISVESVGTIAFHQQLHGILARHESLGLPRLGAVAILLGSCSPNWRDLRGILERSVAATKSLTSGGPNASPEVAGWVAEVLQSLDSLHALRATSLRTHEAKIELVDYVFCQGAAKRIYPDVSKAVLRLLEHKTFAESETSSLKPSHNLFLDLSALRSGLGKFDRDAFERRLKTGVELEVVPVEAELPESERVRSLLVSLANDPELGGMVRLARQMLAAVALPRPLVARDEMPLGGVSDLSNRGTFDRLLITELANDDLTLAVRVATNEALYLRREQPPHSPPMRRTILIDSGVRMWGVPRLISTSLALAFTATADSKLQVSSFRARMESLEPIEIASREGIEQHLAAVEAESHPGAALPSLSNRLDSDDSPADAVVITSQAALADPAFLRQLRELPWSALWLVGVERGGSVRLLQLRGQSLLPVRDFQFRLDDLFAKPAKPQPPLLKESKLDLPAFCRLERPPLRLPHSLNHDKAWPVRGHGVLSIHKDSRLTLWDEAGRGPRELTSSMPFHACHWCDTRDEPVHFAVVGKLGAKSLHLLRIDWQTEETSLTQLNLPRRPDRIAGDGKYLYVFMDRAVEVFDLRGEKVATGIVPWQMREIRGRYYFDTKDHVVLCATTDGAALIMAPIGAKPYPYLEPPLTIVCPQGQMENPFALVPEAIYELTSGNRRPLPAGFVCLKHPIRVSRDESRAIIYVAEPSRPQTVRRLQLLHFLSGTWGEAHHVLDFEPELWQASRSVPSLRRRFDRIQIAGEGKLVLFSGKGQPVGFQLRGGHFILHECPLPAPDRKLTATFSKVDSPGGYQLQVATFPGGSKAWIDSRGLIHLRCADRSQPEVSLVLFSGPTAGWTSHGEQFGNPYFLDPVGPAPVDPATILPYCFARFCQFG